MSYYMSSQGNTPMKSLINNLIETYDSAQSYWKGSIFEPVTKYSTDYKGKWGEELVRDMLTEYTTEIIEWDEDSNTNNDDGVYDIHWTINGIRQRMEVKTSGRTVANGKPVGWQHENVYYGDKSWDYLIFVDYDNDDTMFVTIVKYDEIVINGELDLRVFGKKGHTRKNTTGKSKIDFSLKSQRNGMNAGITFHYDLNSPDDDGLTNFLNNRLDMV